MTELLTILAQANSAENTKAEEGSTSGGSGDGDESEKTPESPDMTMFIMIGVLMVVFFYFTSRSNKRRMREQKEKIQAAKKGDRVELKSGMIGVIDKVDTDNQEVRIIIDEDKNTRALFTIHAIAEIINTEKVSVKKDDAGSTKKESPKEEKSKKEYK